MGKIIKFCDNSNKDTATLLLDLKIPFTFAEDIMYCHIHEAPEMLNDITHGESITKEFISEIGFKVSNNGYLIIPKGTKAIVHFYGSWIFEATFPNKNKLDLDFVFEDNFNIEIDDEYRYLFDLIEELEKNNKENYYDIDFLTTIVELSKKINL